MPVGRQFLRRLVSQEVERQHSPQSIEATARLITDALVRGGINLRRNPSLDEMKWLLAETVRMLSGPQANGAAVRQKRPMEILMVEDSQMFARITMVALRKRNVAHRLTWLSDGQSALDFLFCRGRYARAPRPDLILLDLGLPKIDGREVLGEIKGSTSLRSIPVVVMTASTDPEDAAVSRIHHVEGHLIKPVDFDQFLGLICQLKDFWHEDVLLPSL